VSRGIGVRPSILRFSLSAVRVILSMMPPVISCKAKNPEQSSRGDY
jgi:hypothetical protein